MAGQDATHYALTLTATPGPVLDLRFSYRPDIFARGEMEILARRLVRVMDAFASDAHQAIRRVDMLDAEERRTLLCGWNTARAIPQATVLELFARAVVNDPDAIAVACGEESISYAALDAAAISLRVTCGRSGSGLNASSACARNAR